MLVYNKYLKELGYKKSDFPFKKKDERYNLDKEYGVVVKKLSVIIPVYNELPFLKRCLSSVSKQARDVEVIIVDDGSTDGGAELLDTYICYGYQIYHIENQGVSHARNFGLDKVKTEWVTFLDADDEWTEYAVKNMLKVTDSKEDILAFNQLRHYDSGVIKQRYFNHKGLYTLKKRPKQYCMVWNKMYRTKFLNDNQIRFWEDVSYGEEKSLT